MVDGKPRKTGQEWAEVGFVPDWAGHSRKQTASWLFAGGARARRCQPAALPHGSVREPRPRTKLFGLVTDRDLPGDEVIWWYRERCGKSEEAHEGVKDDLAGGTLPSGLFGANTAG